MDETKLLNLLRSFQTCKRNLLTKFYSDKLDMSNILIEKDCLNHIKIS